MNNLRKYQENNMHTQIVTMSEENIVEEDLLFAAEILKKGGLVAFPTETVYGLGANALDKKAIQKIYQAKGRPSDNPLIIHIANRDMLTPYVKRVPQIAETLMDKFWPGPLTIVLERSEIIHDGITGGLNTVAVRMPSHKVARKLIELADLPIAAPSANLSGRPSPTSAKHVIEDLTGRVDMIIDGGRVNIGLESTVLDLTTTPPLILRPGGITKEMLEEVIGYVEVDPSLNVAKENVIPKSPGMKYKHYAPKGNLIIVEGEKQRVIESINKWVKEKENQGYKTAIITTKESADLYNGSTIKLIGSEKSQKEIAANLFHLLREMDSEEIEYIYTEVFSDKNIGMATMNRLLKAAGNQKIIV